MFTWTEKNEELLAQEYNAGTTVAEIAGKMSDVIGATITKSAICGKIRRLRQQTSLITREADPVIQIEIIWTPPLEDRLRQLCAAFWTDGEIARSMGVGKSTIIKKRKELGIAVSTGKRQKIALDGLPPMTVMKAAKRTTKQPKPMTWTEARCDLVRKMFGEGRSDQDIADALDFDVTPSTVRRKRNDLGCKTPVYAKARSRVVVPAVPLPAPVPETVEPLHVAFIDLDRKACHYPYGTGRDMTFCGHPADAGKSYCAHHQARCYRDERSAAPVGGSAADRQFGDGHPASRLPGGTTSSPNDLIFWTNQLRSAGFRRVRRPSEQTKSDWFPRCVMT